MRTRLMTSAGAVLAIALAVGVPAWSNQTAQTPSQHQHPAQPATPGAPAKTTMDCQSMMAMHQKMMDEMKAMDVRLDSLAQTMNSATGQAKVDAIAAVVNELVTQRKTMRERMASMQGGMMLHMMEHTQSGGAQGMIQCPMMKQMGSMKP